MSNFPNGTFTFLPWEVTDGGACTGGLPSAPVVRVADAEVLEVASGNRSAFVPVMLDAPATEDLTVSFYTVSGSAVGGNAPGAGVDFRNWGTPTSPRSVTIPAGSTQGVIAPPVYGDGVSEGNETFEVKIVSVSGGDYEVAADDTATVTILDADHLGTSDPVITVTNAYAYQGVDGVRKVQFQVQLNKPAASEVQVPMGTQDGTALAGTDYQARSFTLKLPAGSISKTYDVVLVNGSPTVGTTTFSLSGAVASGPLLEELSMTGTGTILAND